MTILTVKDKVGLGQLIIAASLDNDLREKLKDSQKATDLLREFVEIPAEHRVEVYPADDNVTPMMLPAADDIKQALDDAKNLRIGYNDEYTLGDPAYIDPTTDSLRALQFLIGDYILKNCR